MKRIMVVSTVPESSGIGGVTIHTQRLLKSELQRSDGFCLSLFDYKRHGVVDYLRQLSECDAVHIHISNPKARVLFVGMAKARGKKVVLTVHGSLGRHRALNNFFDTTAIRMADIPVLINRKSFEKALKINSKSRFVPAFIPPQIPEPLPEDVCVMFDGIDHSRYRMIYATNASRRHYDDRGNEIYGISSLVDAFSKIGDACLIISDPSGDYSGSEDMADLPNNIRIIKGKHSFFEVLKRTDGMIRATSTDGDAISIKEALYLGKKVLATDCVERPEGVVLFRYNDVESMRDALEKAGRSDIKVPTEALDTAIPHLREIYLSV